MTNHKRQKWLCVDGKCIYAMVEISVNPIPMISVYCRKKHNYIRTLVKSCRDFQNTRLV